MKRKIILLLVLLSGLAPAVLAQTPALDHYNRGIEKSKSGDIEGAISDFSKAIDSDPTLFQAFTSRCVMKFARRDYDGAIADCSISIGLKPEFAENYYDRALARYEKGERQGAFSDYSKAIELDPKYAWALYNRGNLRVERKDTEGALADFNKAIEANPGFFEAYHNRGLLKKERGEYESALADFSKAIELDQKWLLPYYNRGSVKVKLRDFDGAIADLNKALEIEPKDTDSLFQRGAAKIGKKDFDGAIADLTEAIGRGAKYSDAYYLLGMARSGKGDGPGAIAAYTKAIEVSPNAAAYYQARAAAYRIVGNTAAAETDQAKYNGLGGERRNSQGLAAPVKWQDYSVSDLGITFQMPKLPVVNIKLDKQCQGRETREYGAYASGVAYVLRVTFKITPPSSCVVKSEFDASDYLSTANILGERSFENAEASGIKGRLVRGKLAVSYMVVDAENSRWFEFNIVGADEKASGARIFPGSLKFEKTPTGLPVGAGSPEVIGDDTETAKTDAAKPPAASETQATQATPIGTPARGLLIAMQSRPEYTEEARKAQASGVVTLKVVFLSNGGIGDIIQISGPGYGLNQRAIAAAKKTIFIPVEKNGAFTSVSRTLVYDFSLY